MSIEHNFNSNYQTQGKSRRKSRIKLFVTLIVIILCLIGLVAGIGAYRYFHSPRMIVGKALHNTFGEEVFGFHLTEPVQLVRSGEFDHTLSLQLGRLEPADKLKEKIPFDFDLRQLEGLGINAEGTLSYPQSLSSSETEFSYLMKPYFHLECAAYSDTLALRVPELLDSWISIKPADLGRDYNNSLLSSLLKEKLPEDFGYTLFPDTLRPSPEDGSQAQREQLLSLLSALFTETEITKLPAEGSDAESKRYELHFPQDTLDEIAELLFPAGNGSSDSFKLGDTMTLTVSPDDTISQLTYEITFMSDGETCTAALSLQPGGNYFTGECLVTLPKSENLSFSFAGRLLLTDDKKYQLDLEEFTCDSSYGTVTVYGSFTLSEMDSLPAPPTQEDTFDLFSISPLDALRLGKELEENFNESDLRIIKGLL